MGYVNTATDASPNCVLCSSGNLTNCQSCSYVSSTIYCSECVAGYFLDGRSSCVSCSVISNCKTCSSSQVCTGCSSGSLVNGSCVASGCAASVANCLQCSSS